MNAFYIAAIPVFFILFLYATSGVNLTDQIIGQLRSLHTPFIIIAAVSFLSFYMAIKSQTKSVEYLNDIAFQFGLTRDPEKQSSLTGWFSKGMYGVSGRYRSRFVRIETGINRNTRALTIITVMHEDFTEEFKKYRDELPKNNLYSELVLSKIMRSFMGDPIILEDDKTRFIKEHELPKHRRPRVRYHIHHRGLIFSMIGFSRDRKKLLEYLDAAVNLMKYTRA